MTKCYIDITLIELAYWHLIRKQRVTHVKYTWADLFETCERILRYSEQTNRFSKSHKLNFNVNGLEFDSEIFNRRK